MQEEEFLDEFDPDVEQQGALEGKGFFARLDPDEVEPGQSVQIAWGLPEELLESGTIEIRVDGRAVGRCAPNQGNFEIDSREPEVVRAGYPMVGQRQISIRYADPKRGLNLTRDLDLIVRKPDFGQLWAWDLPTGNANFNQAYTVGGAIQGARSLQLRIVDGVLWEDVSSTDQRAAPRIRISGTFSQELVPANLPVRFDATIEPKTWTFYQAFRRRPTLTKRFVYSLTLLLEDQFKNGYEVLLGTRPVDVEVSSKKVKYAKTDVRMQALSIPAILFPPVSRFARQASEDAHVGAYDPLEPDFAYEDLYEPSVAVSSWEDTDPKNRATKALVESTYTVYVTLIRLRELAVAEARWFGARLHDEDVAAARQRQHYAEVLGLLQTLQRELEGHRDVLADVSILTREEVADRFATWQAKGVPPVLIQALIEAGLTKIDVQAIRSAVYLYGPAIVPERGVGPMLRAVVTDLDDIVGEVLGGQPLVPQPA